MPASATGEDSNESVSRSDVPEKSDVAVESNGDLPEWDDGVLLDAVSTGPS